jgi:hypothetical protein
MAVSSSRCRSLMIHVMRFHTRRGSIQSLCRSPPPVTYYRHQMTHITKRVCFLPCWGTIFARPLSAMMNCAEVIVESSRRSRNDIEDGFNHIEQR